MKLNELLKNLSWIKTEEINNNHNCVTDFINSFNLKQTKFEIIQKKIACAYIDLNTINGEKFFIVLKENYTEKEFVDFLKKLNIDTPIEYGTGTVWSKKGNFIWHYKRMFEEDYDMYEYDWVATSIPAIPKDCKRKKDK